MPGISAPLLHDPYHRTCLLNYDTDYERSVVAITVQRAVENVKMGVGAYCLRVTGNVVLVRTVCVSQGM